MEGGGLRRNQHKAQGPRPYGQSSEVWLRADRYFLGSEGQVSHEGCQERKDKWGRSWVMDGETRVTESV